MTDRYKELVEWLGSLEPRFAFLLALPFAVALAGLLAKCIRGFNHRRRLRLDQERPLK